MESDSTIRLPRKLARCAPTSGAELSSPHSLQHLVDSNARWAQAAIARDPHYFRRLAVQRSPRYLWIGAADGPLPAAHDILGVAAGDVLVHRNLGNVVSNADLNGQSLLQFAIDAARVEHIVVVGHPECSAVRQALEGCGSQLSDHWLGNVRAVADRHRRLLAAEPTAAAKLSLLCEINVIEQAINVCASPAAIGAWRRGQPLSVHAWLYQPGDGRLQWLQLCVNAECGEGELREDMVERLMRVKALRNGNGNLGLGLVREPLTYREKQVLAALSDGHTNAAIAQLLQISTNTVASHLRNIYQKIGTSSRMHALLAARAMKESGLLRTPVSSPAESAETCVDADAQRSGDASLLSRPVRTSQDLAQRVARQRVPEFD